MALNKSALLIRDYDNIRQILRDIYIYGCFSRDDFIEKGISGRKYDNEQRRISAYLPDKFIKKRRVNKRVLLYCEYNMEDTAHNYLAETYRNKSFTLLDVMAYFFVLQILGDGKERSLPQILNELPNYNESRMFTKDNLRIKLDELVEEGLIIAHKQGKNVNYSIGVDLWEDFSTDELEDMYMYLEFLKNSSPIEMPYYFLQRKLGLYLMCNRGIDDLGKSPIQFKHNHMFNTLDNDIMLELLRATEASRALRISIMREGRENLEVEVIPILIIHDSIYGRQYLLCEDKKHEIIRSVRLDKITDAEITRDLLAEELDSIKIRKEMLYSCWSVLGFDKELTEVKIKLFINEEKEQYILRRIDKEGHGGKIDKICDGEYLFTVDMRDPMEMVPWIRSFGERALVISSGDFPLRQSIKEDWERAVSKYEALS